LRTIHHPKGPVPPSAWIYDPAWRFKHSKAKVPDSVKADVLTKAQELIEKLKPEHVKPPTKGSIANYIVDIYSKWHGPFFYFYSKYKTRGPWAIAPSFEHAFARLQYADRNPKTGRPQFNLAYHRHTGEWLTLDELIPLKKGLDEIASSGFYLP
jgi:hypothetical protein